jgi:hypothetical protein
MNDQQQSLKKTARIAGLLYLLLAITGGYGIMYVPSQVVVRDDIAATASNILNHEFLFRSGIMSNLICQTLFVFLVLTLYRLFEQVNVRVARTMFALVLVSVPIAFFIIFNQLYALMLLKEQFMTVFQPAEIQALAMSYLAKYNYGNSVIGIFWGLWLIPFGQLVWQSGFIPKLLGIFLILGGVAYCLDVVAFVLFPDYRSLTGSIVGITSSVAEIAMVLWLLIFGVRQKSVQV